MMAESIGEYVKARGAHRGGAMWKPQLLAIERICPSGGVTIETGCGASTILFSRLSSRHTVFTLDDRGAENGSVQFVTEAPLYRPETVQFVFGATQETLRSFKFESKINVALIDGPHAYPFPELEYYFIYPYLATHAILIVDDIHIPTVFNFYRFLREEKMFAFIEKYDNTAFFRRTDTPTFDPLGAGWEDQEFNRHHFPVVGQDDRIARRIPKWLTHLFPRRIRSAIKERVFLKMR